MPYLRAAHEWDWNAQALHISALYMQSNVNPVSGVFQTDGSNGRDLYSDYAFDAGYQYLGDGTHIGRRPVDRPIQRCTQPASI